MIYLTLGVPSRFSEWCESIFRELLVQAGAAPEIFVADQLEQVGREILARRTLCALVVSRQPQKKLKEAVMASQTPIMVTLDKPEHAVGALMTDHGETFPNAVRRVASCLTTLLQPGKFPNTLIFNATDDPAAADVANAIVIHFGIGLDEAAIHRAIENLPTRAPSPPDMAALAASQNIIDALASRAAERHAYGYGDEDDRTPMEIATAALSSLWSHVLGDPLREIFWHPALFFNGDHPSEPAITPIDVTGSRRCLFFGPYMLLPEGSWTCSLLLGCAKSAVGVGLTVDVFAGVTLNSVDVEVTEPGLFEIAMSFVNPNPDSQIEVRLFSMKPNFEGNILPGSVRLTSQRANPLRTG